MRPLKATLFLALLAVHPLTAQTPANGAQADAPDKTFFKKSDLLVAGGIVAGSALVSVFDERFAHWAQSKRIQADRGVDLAEQLTFINETPLTLGAAATYAVGRLAGNETIADVGAHWTEAMVLTVGVTELVRVSLGRIRPRAAEGNAFSFEPGQGFTEFEARSYPSLHAAAAFATASVLAEEIGVRKPGAAKIARPLLYTAALVPGFTRLYLNEHWASDVAAGMFVGGFLGARVVSYAHTHNRNKLDRLLLGATVMPSADGRVMVGSSLRW